MKFAMRNKNTAIAGILWRNDMELRGMGCTHFEVIGTELHDAVIKGDNDLVRTLIREGADIEALDSFKYSVFGRAMEHQNIEAMQILLDNGYNINTMSQFGNTLLHQAVDCLERDNAAVIRCLLENGAEVNALNMHNETALVSVSFLDEATDVIKCLVDNGADVNAADGGHSPLLHQLAMHSNCLDSIIFLVEHGADVYHLSRGIDVLFYAKRTGDPQTIKYLESIIAADSFYKNPESNVNFAVIDFDVFQSRLEQIDQGRLEQIDSLFASLFALNYESFPVLSMNALIDHAISGKWKLEVSDYTQNLIDFYRENGASLNGLEDFLMGEVIDETGAIAASYKKELHLTNISIFEANYLDYIAVNPASAEIIEELLRYYVLPPSVKSALLDAIASAPLPQEENEDVPLIEIEEHIDFS